MPEFFTPQPMPATGAARYASRTASRVLRKPTPGPSFWPVAKRSPTSSALRQRISQPSIPTRSARRSSIPSMAKAVWFAPKPRIAPEGGLFV
jgi:hypothetical protein